MSASLPVIPRTVIPYTRPDTGEKIQLVAFNSGMEHDLLMAKDGTPEQRASVLASIISDCSAGSVDPNTVPLYVVEDMFLRLREASIGDKQELTYICRSKLQVPVDPADPEQGTRETDCNMELHHTLDLKQVRVEKHPDHTLVFDFSGVGVKLRYPMLSDYKKLTAKDSDLRTLALCTQQIFSGDEVFEADDYTLDQLESWYRQLTPTQLALIKDKAVNKMPSLAIKAEIVCPRCKTVHKLQAKGLNELFK